MVQRKSRFWLEVLVLVGLTLGCTKQSAASSWSFEYDQGKPTANSECASTALVSRGWRIEFTFTLLSRGFLKTRFPVASSSSHWGRSSMASSSRQCA